MKIGFLAPSNLMAGGGFEHWLYEVTSRISSRNSVSIFVFNRGPRQWNVEGKFRDVAVIEATLNRKVFFPRTFENNQLNSLFKDSDLIYTIDFTAPGMIGTLDLMRFRTGTPVILGHHTPFNWYTNQPSLRGSVVTVMGNRLTAHHALNEDMKKMIINRGGKNVYKIPYGVNTSSFKPQKKFKKFSILFVGRLVKGKGVELLPRIISELTMKNLDFDLYIAGDGPLANIVQPLASDRRIKWLGYVDEERKELYSSCHVLIAPSQAETFLLTGLEAMSSGTPVVTFDIAGPREYVIDEYNGYLTHGLQEFISRIIFIHDLWSKNNDHYHIFSKNARRTAEKFDWQMVVPEIERMFSDVKRL
jgi:glycosyltransferase involved in cell wall biosynthesis